MTFSLKTLFLASTLVCLYVATVFAMPAGLALLLLAFLQFLLPAVCVAGILYSRRGWKAFWIGTAIGGGLPMLVWPWLLLMIAMDTGFADFWSDLFSYDVEYMIRDSVYMIAIVQTVTLCCGVAAAATRRVFRSSRTIVPGQCLE